MAENVGKTRSPGRPSKSAKPETATPKPTKKAQLIALLGKGESASIAGLSAALGWQLHSTRAALTGLRRAGFEIEKGKAEDGGETLYRITAAPEESA